tara:strand:- start:147103 stop:147336 length:234 start_codon:yes stop_codon:yes gene_type:complete
MTNLKKRSVQIIKGDQVVTDNASDIDIANDMADALIYLLKEIDDGDCYRHIFKRMNEYLYESYFQEIKSEEAEPEVR